jgi:hypothetical protein
MYDPTSLLLAALNYYFLNCMAYSIAYDLAAPASNNASPTRDGGESSSRDGNGRKRIRAMLEDDDPVIWMPKEFMLS